MIATITTACRLDLFKRTVDSFKMKCLDFDLVNCLLIFDDGSSLDDQKAMEIHCKNLGINCNVIGEVVKKSHAANLNGILRSFEFSQKFVFMGEDDWTLSRKGCFLLAAQDVLINNPSIGQVCLGRDAPYVWRGEEGRTSTPTGTEYVLLPEFNDCQRYCPFTLNPSVFRVDALQKTGLFDLTPNFEYSYGKRFADLGWRTAHLYPSALEHIGHGRSAYDITGSVR